MVNVKDKPQKASEDNRAGTRQRVLLTGRLVHSPQELTTDCAIESLSETGARVRLAGSTPIVDPVFLIHMRYGLGFKVRVVWRRDLRLGLSFDQRYDLRKPPADCPFVLTRLWRQISPAR
jgi:hypothetical protein